MVHYHRHCIVGLICLRNYVSELRTHIFSLRPAGTRLQAKELASSYLCGVARLHPDHWKRTHSERP